MFKLLFIMLISTEAFAFDSFDVDWPERKPGENYHILRITIDDCESKFKVKNEDFYVFAKKEKATTEAMEKAIERAENGCKN